MNDKAPLQIGNYRILKILGQGSMGTSYLAEHELTTRKVSIKLADADVPHAIERLKAEAKSLSRLVHENVHKVFDAGISKNGQFYLVKEWIDGKDLKSVLRERIRLKPSEIVQVLEALSKAIDYVHSKGVIHRDIKPSNILIPADDIGFKYGNAKLTDFSLVGELRNDTHQTQAGEIFGTPYYMSPEQIRGEPQSSASDIYSIGIVVYEMVYGRTPFRQKNIIGLFTEIIQGNIRLPDDPDVPSDLKALIKKCIDPDPQRRISSGEEFINAVKNLSLSDFEKDSVSEHTTIRPGPVSAAQRKKAFPNFLILVISCAILVILTWGWISYGRPVADVAKLIGSIVLIFASVLIGINLGKLFDRAKPAAQRKAESILTGTSDRETLTKSIAIEIDSVFEKLKRFDEKVLAESLVLMVREYDDSKESDDRQKALMNAVTILGKLTERLSPWYVRHEKVLAFAVSSVGIISGLATAAATIIKMLSK